MRLLDCFIRIFVYVPDYLAAAGDYEPFRAKLASLIDDARDEARRILVSDGDFDAALFAVVAWVDETVMCSHWSGGDRWRRATLQMQFFRSSRAGVEFYTRLEGLTASQRQVREVYYMALASGFRGRFASINDQPALDLLKQQQVLALLDSPARLGIEGGEPLFPTAHPVVRVAPLEKPRRWFLGSMPLTMLAAPAAVVVILYLSFSLILGANVRQILAAIH